MVALNALAKKPASMRPPLFAAEYVANTVIAVNCYACFNEAAAVRGGIRLTGRSGR